MQDAKTVPTIYATVDDNDPAHHQIDVTKSYITLYLFVEYSGAKTGPFAPCHNPTRKTGKSELVEVSHVPAFDGDWMTYALRKTNGIWLTDIVFSGKSLVTFSPVH